MAEQQKQDRGRLSATVVPPDQGVRGRPNNKGLHKLCRRLTPPQIAERYGVSPDKVLGWIRTGELRALNVATRLGGRPRYSVDEEDLVAFEKRRQVQPQGRQHTRRQRPGVSNVIEFF